MPPDIHPHVAVYLEALAGVPPGPRTHSSRHFAPLLIACKGDAVSRPEGPKAPARTRTILVRMTPQEHADVRSFALSLGISMSRLLRSRPEALPPPRADLALAADFARIGNNLNQMTRAVNSGTHPELVLILAELAALQEVLSQFRGLLRRRRA